MENIDFLTAFKILVIVLKFIVCFFAYRYPKKNYIQIVSTFLDYVGDVISIIFFIYS